MPLKTPSSPPKSSGKPAGKTIPASAGRGKSKPAAPKKKSRAALPPEAPSVSWWASLTDERKLDVVGLAMVLVGLATALILFSAQRSDFTGTLITFFTHAIGWGIYILPVGMIIMGFWLIFRRIEKLPRLTLERFTGFVLLFLWLLTILQSFIPADMRDQAVQEGVGGGQIGNLFAGFLYDAFGTLGVAVILVAWLLLATTMIFDVTVRDLFSWIPPLLGAIRAWLSKSIGPRASARPASPARAAAASNGFTPLDRPKTVVVNEIPGKPVTTVRSAEAVIQWQLPDVKQVLITGAAPSVNEEFIQQRARLIAETLASFGAPVQVVEINRGPTITQFGVEPLYLETRTGRIKVRVSKIASLADDLALALAAPRIRIQAPVPGHSYVGIEVPNDEMTLVALRDILESDTFQRHKSALRLALGQDVAGHPITTCSRTCRTC